MSRLPPSSLLSAKSKKELVEIAGYQARMIRLLDARVNDRENLIKLLTDQLESGKQIATFFHGPPISPLAPQDGRGVARSRKRG